MYGDVSTDQLEAWDIAREMSFRTAWKPYMYSQTLPHLLGGIRSPALVVWGVQTSPEYVSWCGSKGYAESFLQKVIFANRAKLPPVLLTT